MSKRENLRQYYLHKAGQIVQANVGTSYAFKGEAFSPSVLVRIDLNGYTAWGKTKNISEKISMLDGFFTYVLTRLDTFGGVFYRDEGDCILALFSDYFQTGATDKSVVDFCMAVTQGKFGLQGELSVKTIVTVGEVLYFQKSHEVGTHDWSAEGQLFIDSARFEAAVESKKRIYFFKEFYDRFFDSQISKVPDNSPINPAWIINAESIQIPGLNLTGGWKDIVSLEWNWD